MSLRMLKDLDCDFPHRELLPMFEMESKLYQGAHTGAYVSGLYIADEDKDWYVWHNDVRSMYPSIMRLCNFSPESMRLVKLKPYTGEYYISPTLFEIPDNRINKQLTIEVDEEDSISREEVTKLMNLRQKYRAEKSDSSEKAMKLAANAYYGYHGMKYARYGSFLVALATAGIGRYVMENTVAISDALPDSITLEDDTDGMYNYGVNVLEPLQLWIAEAFKDFPQKYAIQIESVKYYGMLCTGNKKNYVLRKNHRNIIKGNSLKGRSMPGVCKKALEWMADALFENSDIYKTWEEIRTMVVVSPLDRYEMSVEVGKDPDDYKPHTMYAKILKQAPWMQHGEELRYVKCTTKWDGYQYVPLGAAPDEKLLKLIDIDYYWKRTKEVAKRVLYPCREQLPEVDKFCRMYLDKKPKKKRQSKKPKSS